MKHHCSLPWSRTGQKKPHKCHLAPLCWRKVRQVQLIFAKTTTKSRGHPQSSVWDDRFLNENVREALPLSGWGRTEVLFSMPKSQEGECEPNPLEANWRENPSCFKQGSFSKNVILPLQWLIYVSSENNNYYMQAGTPPWRLHMHICPSGWLFWSVCQKKKSPADAVMLNWGSFQSSHVWRIGGKGAVHIRRGRHGTSGGEGPSMRKLPWQADPGAADGSL